MTLVEAIQSKDFKVATELVNNGQKTDIKTALQDTFFFQNLHIYASGIPLIEALANKGFIELDMYEYNNMGTSVFGHIIRFIKENSTPQNLQSFKSLLQKTENIDEPVNGINLMSYAIENNAPCIVLKTLMEKGCDVNFLNEKGENYFHKVVMRAPVKHKEGDSMMVDLYFHFFIEEGLDINAPDHAGLTPLLHYLSATNRFDKETLELLIKHGADINAETPKNKTAFDLAMEKYDIEQCVLLMEHGATLDTDSQDNKQQSSVYRFLSTLPYEASELDLALFHLYLKAEFDLFQMNKSNYGVQETPLDIILQKAPEYTEALLDEMDFDVNEIDQDGNTALHKACAFNINFEERKAKDVYKKVKLLIKAGADASLQNNKGKTAHELAAQHNKNYITVEYLLKRE